LSESPQPISDSSGSPSNDQLAAGSMFAQRFELLQLIGKGASGSAYKARDILLDRIVLLKILHSYLLASPDAVERFRREALTAIQLTHPGIVQVFVHGVADDGRSFLVMDYLQGASLAQILAEEKRLSLDRVLNIFTQLVDALQFAHERNVIHRDVKPSNIMIVPDGEAERAVLVDFGIAKVLDDANEQSSTKTGEMLGSTAYMSPEQCIGAAVDGRSDIYSLACVIYEALIGEPLFEGSSSFDVMYKHLNQSVGDLAKLTKLPDVLAKLLRKCLAKKADERFSSMAELKAGLAECASLRDSVKRKWQPNGVGKGDTPRLSRKVVIALGLIAVALLIGCVISMRIISLRRPIYAARKDSSLDDQHLSSSVSWLDDTLDKYPNDREKAKSILLRWSDRFMNSSAPEALEGKIYVLKRLSVLSDIDQKLDDELKYLRQLSALSPKNQSIQLFVGLHTGGVLEKRLKLKEAIAAFEEGLSKINRQDDIVQTDLFLTLAAEADAYAALTNYKEAVSLYRDATAVALKDNRKNEFIKDLRGKTIILLELEGKQNDADELLKTALADMELYREREFEPESALHDLKQLLRKDIPPVTAPSLNEFRKAVKKSIAGYYEYLRDWSIAMQSYPSFLKYSRLAATAYLELGDKTKSAEILSSTSEAASNRSDSLNAVKFAKDCLPLLKDDDKDGLQKLKLLTSLLYIYHFNLRMPDEERRCLHEAVTLLNDQLEKNPQLFWQKPDPSYAKLISCMRYCETTKGTIEKTIDAYIDKCAGHQCLSLDGFLKEKINCLMDDKRLAEAEALADKCINDMKSRNNKNELFAWLDLQAEILSREAKYDQEIAVLEQASKLLEINKKGDWRHYEFEIRYATCYSAMGQNQKADESCNAVLAEIGPDTPENNAKIDTPAFDQLRWFSGYLVGRGKIAEANLLLNRIMKEETLRFGSDSPRLVEPSFDLALLALKQNRAEEACNAFRQIVKICDKYGGYLGIRRKSLEYLKNCKN